ncbi:MAG: tRNA (N6-isopentenyl adenosine(37)-C2)-methylthiotransferase MiaB [Acutalibacteraceae bacterium]|nr:tRNA (N6-isopentenyl adenosine(37)-C2)-methylthiotransferase MiaB [Acutalibacteraceae bacterium]
MKEIKTQTLSEEQLNVQREYTEKLKDILPNYFNHTPCAFVHSYGCQQNVSDSERMKGMLEKMGFVFVDNPESADLILYNTCAVREHAEDRVYGNVGMLKAKRQAQPECIIALCGCMVQQEHIAEKIRKSFPYVNLLFGTHAIYQLPELIYNYVKNRKRVFYRPESDGIIAENVPVRRDSNFKGWLPIMYGCNNFCTYCIVPFVRGRERSRKPEHIIEEAKQMVNAGFKDITLLGQNVNSYGKAEGFDVDFAKLLRKINDIEGDFQIRFMTSHPKDCTLELLDAMKDCDKVCKHLHLPFQSGSNRVLNAMNRKYTREHYLYLIEQAKKRMPDISLTSDIIVGFPGETYEEFKDTLSLIKEVKFTSLFTFIYSKRKGTPAENMPDNISHKQKTEWMKELLDTQEKIAAERTASYLNGTYRVLCEECHEDSTLFGRTQSNIGITFKGDKKYVGKFINVKITKALNWVLEGEIVGE